MRLRRTYFFCAPCQLGESAADNRLGILNSLTRKARELICTAGIDRGFATGAKRLLRYCGWTVSEQTVRRTCEREGALIENWREGRNGAEAVSTSALLAAPTTPTVTDVSNPSETSARLETPMKSLTIETAAPKKPEAKGAAATQTNNKLETAAVATVAKPLSEASTQFRQAKGEIEFSTDGTSVNTLDGWRELRIALWLKRPLSNPAQTYEWDTRQLPKATARSVLIDLAPADQFGARWRDRLADLGITNTTDISVLADGAEWIWNQVRLQFPGAVGVLDIYHASEHLSDAAKAIFELPGAALAWSNVGTIWMIQQGWQGICRWINKVREVAGSSPKCVETTEELIGYFSKHTTHLTYRQRLASGQSIGSGPVEGAAKQLVGRRLKQTGARWRTENTVTMATLVSAEWADDWELYWNQTLPKQPKSPSLAI